MTTNNHPAHGPVSLERLHQISEILSKASAQSDGGNLGYAMADAVKVIEVAIASFDEGDNPRPAMAVKGELGFIDRLEKIIEERDKDIDIGQLGSSNYDALMLAALDAFRASPPAVPSAMSPVVEVGEIIAYERHGERFSTIVGATWNSCRAAMLQAGNHTEQHLDMVDHSGDDNEKADCKLPFDQWLSQQNEPIDVDCGCVTTEAFYHWLRVAYEAGNSPVTPDGWQLVPKEPTAAMNKACWDAMNEHDAINPTYRAMLAAAPKQEVKAALEHGMQRYAGDMQKLSEGDK